IALETLIELGVDRILTSGQEPTAYEGVERIAELVKAAVDRLIVMPGGGINARNVARVAAITGASEIHFAARAPAASPMRYRRADMYMGGELRPPKYDRLETTPAAVGAVINAATRVRRQASAREAPGPPPPERGAPGTPRMPPTPPPTPATPPAP